MTSATISGGLGMNRNSTGLHLIYHQRDSFRETAGLTGCPGNIDALQSTIIKIVEICAQQHNDKITGLSVRLQS